MRVRRCPTAGACASIASRRADVGSRCPLPTAVSGSSPNTCSESSTCISRRKRRAAVSGCRWSTGRCKCTTGRSKYSRRLARARRSACCCLRRSAMKNATSRWSRVLVAFAVTALCSGCVHTAAKTSPDGPPLDVPAAPPRPVEANEAEAPQPIPLISEPARNTPARPRQTPAREQPARPEPPKTEPPRTDPPPSQPMDAPRPAEEPPKPPVNLQTTPAQAEVEEERNIRASLVRANTDLSRIDYRGLNADARTQYDTAKRFVRQADDALKGKNLVFAKNLAEKAAAIAAQLGGR